MHHTLRAFALDDRGTATAEYSIVLVVFGAAVIAALQVFLGESSSQLSTTQSHLSTTALQLPAPAN